MTCLGACHPKFPSRSRFVNWWPSSWQPALPSSRLMLPPILLIHRYQCSCHRLNVSEPSGKERGAVSHDTQNKPLTCHKMQQETAVFGLDVIWVCTVFFLLLQRKMWCNQMQIWNKLKLKTHFHGLFIRFVFIIGTPTAPLFLDYICIYFAKMAPLKVCQISYFL